LEADSAIKYPGELLNIFNLDNESILQKLNNHSFSQDSRGSLHLSAYSGDYLINLLREVGFSHVYKSAVMQSRFPPMREAPIFDGTHPWLSLYVEAIK